METRLGDLFQSLPEGSRPAVLKALDAHATYLSSIGALSRDRLQKIVDSTNTSASASSSSRGSTDGDHAQVGPGIYLLRWHGLLDETPITPETAKGHVRRGKDVKHTLAQGKTAIVGGAKTSPSTSQLHKKDEDPTAPDVGIVVRELGEGFVKILQEVGGPDR